MKARKWVVYCADNEWGNTVMEALARAKFADDPSIDCITVHEHGGWFLSFNRDMVCVGTANDMARLSPESRTWAKRFDGCEIVGYERRPEPAHVYDHYWPRLASAVA